MKTTYSLVFLLFYISSTTVFTQNVIISEYYNISANPSGEWTELLITQDNTNLVGYTIRDNVGTNGIPNNWQGGVKFLNHNLWKNLRAGTIIVIHHRGNTEYDTNKDDGYIEIGAENETYFEKRCFGCLLSEWNFKALNIAQTAEIIQIIDTTDNHVHSLSHMPIPAGDYLTLPSPKINSPNQLTGSSSVIVVPGLSLSAYNAGNDNSQTAITNNPSLGKPNNSLTSIDENQIFWRKLRQPEWLFPSLKVEIIKDSVILSWNSCYDALPDDNTQGYLIVRVKADDLNYTHISEDGKIYNKNDDIGNPVGKVIAVINSSRTTKYIDYLKGMCGNSFIYRVFAFRYSKDDLNQDFIRTNARGRSYNETEFAETKIDLTFPKKPDIKIETNTSKFCNGDSVILFGIDDGGLYHYEWYKNGKKMGLDTKELNVKESGLYEFEVTNSFGCSIKSNAIEITVYESPEANIYINYEKIQKDTSIYICKDEKIELLATGGFEIYWYKNENLLSRNSTIQINSNGLYYAIVKNEFNCYDSSIKIHVKVLDIKFSLSPDTLIYELNELEDEQEQDIKITNYSDDTLKFINCILPKNFTIINCNLPFIIPPNEYLIITIKYKPETSGKLVDKLILESFCDINDTVFLICNKKTKGLISNCLNIDFPLLLSCDTNGYDTTLTILNPNNEEYSIVDIYIKQPFAIISPKLPYNLLPKEKIDITIHSYTSVNGQISDTLFIIYKSKIKTDTIRITLNLEVHSPSFKSNYDSIIFSPLIECDEYKDTNVIISNTSKVPLSFSLHCEDEIILNEYSFNINPNEYKTINIRIIPQTYGIKEKKIKIIAEPCSIEKNLFIQITKEKIEYSFNIDTLDFGIIEQCNDSSTIKKPLKVFVIGNSSYNSKIIDVIIKGNFEHNIELYKNIQDSVEYEISFLPGSDGIYQGEILIKFEPCNVEKKIYLKGQRASPKFSISSKELDFGLTTESTIATKELKIQNLGLTNINIKNIDGIASPFFLSPYNINLPYLLKPDSSISFFFDYFQRNLSKDSINIRVFFDYPCEFQENIKLKGEVYNTDRKFSLLQVLDYPQVLSVDSNANCDIILQNYQSSNISDLVIDSIYVHFIFNQFVLDILRIEKGKCLDNTHNSEITYDISNKLGQATIKVRNIDKKIFTSPCNIITLILKALLGNSLSSIIRIDSIFIYANKKVEVITTDGEIRIEDNCNLEKRLVEINSSPLIMINNSFIEYKVISDERTSIKLYNLLGNEIYTIIDDYLKPNKYTQLLDKDKFPNGIYFLVFKNGNIIKRMVVVF